MENHKYDRRGAGDEGRFAQGLYDLSCKEAGRKYREASIKEDCQGIDRYVGDRAIDAKARKKGLTAHLCWVEVAKAGGSLRSGWSFKNKWIAQMMLYEEKKVLTRAIFGEYHTSDLIEFLEAKVDWNSNADYGKLYQLYTRWTDGEHRGMMTVISYADIESFKSFSALDIPRWKWEECRKQYGLLMVAK